jgi:cysteine-rich repeat protein
MLAHRRLGLGRPVVALALGLALHAAKADGAIALVKSVGTAGNRTTSTSTSVAVPAAGVAAGGTLLVTLALDPASGAVSCADAAGNVYAKDLDVTNGSGTTGVRSVVFSAPVGSALAAGALITVTHPSVAAKALSVSEFSGLSASGPLDRSATATGNSVAPSAGPTAATVVPEELVLGAIGVETRSPEPFAPGAGFTALASASSGSTGTVTTHVMIDPEFRIVSTTGSQAADGTITPARQWAAAVVTYRAACGDGALDAGEACDDGNRQDGDCCSGSCGFEAPGTICRAAAGACDLAEACTGSSGACPADAKSVAVCRPAAGPCDTPETCDGAGDACPADARSTALCRPASGTCDVPEHCDGIALDCPSDHFRSPGVTCRTSTGACDPRESCTGSGPDCPVDAATPDADGDGVCDDTDACPADPDSTQSDRDGDGISDACDPCTNFVPVFIRRPRLTIGRLDTLPGDDTLRLRGMMTVPTSPVVDPAAHGLRVLLVDAAGATILDAMVPPGRSHGRGWTTNRAGTAWTYRDREGDRGIVKVRLATLHATPGTLAFEVVGRNGSYPVSPLRVPLRGTVVIDAPAARRGQCAEAVFPGPWGPRCAFDQTGRTLHCR